MYYSIFYSQSLYGCLVWSHLEQSNIDPIKKLQNFYVWITFLPDLNTHTNGLFFQLKLLKITGILEMQKVILMFDLRILIGKKPTKIKLQRLRKIQTLTFGSFTHQINSF